MTSSQSRLFKLLFTVGNVDAERYVLRKYVTRHIPQESMIRMCVIIVDVGCVITVSMRRGFKLIRATVLSKAYHCFLYEKYIIGASLLYSPLSEVFLQSSSPKYHRRTHCCDFTRVRDCDKIDFGRF